MGGNRDLVSTPRAAVKDGEATRKNVQYVVRGKRVKPGSAATSDGDRFFQHRCCRAKTGLDIPGGNHSVRSATTKAKVLPQEGGEGRERSGPDFMRGARGEVDTDSLRDECPAIIKSARDPTS